MPSTDNFSGLNHGKCLICGSDRVSYKFPAHGAPVHQCGDCALLFLRPIPSRAQPGALSRTAGLPREHSVRWLRKLASYGNFANGSVLDAGFCAEPLPFPDGYPVNVLRQSLPEEAGTSSAPEASSGSFDACVFLDSLQKTGNPVRALSLIGASLREEGSLLLTVPAITAPASENEAAFAEGNNYFFDLHTLRNLLARCGFADVRAESFRVDSSRTFIAALGRKRRVRSRPMLSIIMPVYNEAGTFREMYSRLKAKTFPSVDKEIVIVESNSTDGTRAMVEAVSSDPGVRVRYEDRPMGKGHAVRTGLETASGDFIAIQDGDLEYDINDYDQLLEPLVNYRQAFVLGSRHSLGWKMRTFSGQPLLSFVMNCGQTLCTALINLFCGTRMKDPFTMYKLFRRDCLSGLSFYADRFDFDWEIVIKLVRKGYIPLEIPVNYTSRSFSEGKKVSMLRDPLLWCVALVRFRFCRLYDKKY